MPLLSFSSPVNTRAGFSLDPLILQTREVHSTFSRLSDFKPSPQSFSTSKIFQQSPMLLVPPSQQMRNAARNQKALTFRLFDPVENKFVELTNRRLPEELRGAGCAGSSNGWLGFVNGSKFFLANLISGNDFPITIPLSRMRKDARCLPFENLDYYCRFINNRAWEQYVYTNLSERSVEPIKIAVSSSPTDPNCTIMITDHFKGDLGFCRVGDSSWTWLGNQFIIQFADIIYSKKHRLFYALNGGHRFMEVQTWDLTNPDFPYSKVTEFSLCHSKFERRHPAFSERTNYLVETPEGEFLLVKRYRANVAKDGSLFRPKRFADLSQFPSKTVGFEIYKINFDKKTGEIVEHLGDIALFLGANESFSLSTKDYPGLKSNSIYFNNDHPDWYDHFGQPYGGHDIGIFDLEDLSVSPLHSFVLKKIKSTSIWVFPMT